MPGRTDRVGGIPSSGGPSRCLLPRHQAPLCLLVLPESPLVALDLYPAVVADGCRNCLDPI